MPKDVERILLIHPDLKVTDQLTFLLQHRGFQVPTADDADQALAAIARTEPDVIIMAETLAKVMAKAPGKSIADDPRIQIPQRCKAPIIILGEHSKERPEIPFLESGADAYLPSPLSLRLLLARVRSLLRPTKAIDTGSQVVNNPTNQLFNERR